MNNINLCIIGAGRIFQLYHLDAIINSGFFNIKYVVDKNFKIAKSNAKIVNAKALTDIKDVKNCEGFFIATPPNTRLDIFKLIKHKSKFIIFEKPVAFSFDEVKKIVDESSKNNIRCLVAQTRRFFPNLNFVNELISNGFISSPFDVKIYEGAPFGWITESNYLLNSDPKDNGVIHDVGAHVYDYLISMLESFKIDHENINTNSALVDYNKLPNNILSHHTVKSQNKTCNIEIKLSRSILLMNKIIITDGKNTVFSRPLLEDTIKLKISNKEFNVPVPYMQGKSYSLDNAFLDMWIHIGNVVQSKDYDKLCKIDLNSVIKTVKLMDYVIEKKEINSIDNYFKNFGHE